MKKIFLISALCFCCNAIFAQMSFSSENFVTETVDEFGDKTGNIKVGIKATGYFSNSATTNSCAHLIISMMQNTSWYNLYEYCGNHASSDDFIITFEGTATKEIVKAIYDVPMDFLKLCKNNDSIKVRMKEKSDYGTTSAVFKLFKCKSFYKNYTNTFGEIQYRKFLIRDNSLCVFNSEIAANESYPSFDLPRIEFKRSAMGDCEEVSLGGKFKSGEYLSASNVFIDGGQVSRKVYYSFQPDNRDFMTKMHQGSKIEIHHKDGKEKETFEITPELYDVIAKFFQE